MHVFSLLPSLGNRGGAVARWWQPSPAVWASGVAGRRGKGRERLKGSIPPSILGKEARRAEIHGRGRQAAAAAMVAPRWGSTAAKVRRDCESEARRSYCTSYPGPRQREEAAPRWPACSAAMAVVAALGARGEG